MRYARWNTWSAFAGAILESSAEAPQCDLLVSVLAPLILTDDDDAGRAVGQPDGGLSSIDVLSPGAARTEGIHVALIEEVLVG